MTYAELSRLDNYGHKPFEELTEDQLSDYIALLKARRRQVQTMLRSRKRRLKP